MENSVRFLERRPTVLVVDDEPDMRNIWSRSLRSCRVHEAANASEAIARILSNRPDAIILDRNMPGLVQQPGMGGDAVLAWLHANDFGRQILVVMHSVKDTVSDQQRLLSNGAHLFFPKSIDMRVASLTLLRQLQSRSIAMLSQFVGVLKESLGSGSQTDAVKAHGVLEYLSLLMQKQEARRVQVDLMFLNVLAQLDNLYMRKGGIQIHMPGNSQVTGCVFGNERLLSLAIYHVGEFLLQFAHVGTSVTVGISQTAREFHISIEAGLSLPQDLMATLFWWKPNDSRVGIGLPLAWEVAAIHGGDLVLDESSVGVTRFVLRLPAEQ